MASPRLLVGPACTLSLLLLLLGACRTDGPDTTAPPSPSDTTAAPADTSTARADTAARPNTPPPAPAPGTARLRAEITACDAAMEPVQCEMDVEEILGYGSATPPLRTGTHTVAVAASLLANRDASALPALGPRTLVLRHAGDQPTLGGQTNETRPEWTLQSIE